MAKRPPVITKLPRKRLEGEGAEMLRRVAEKELRRVKDDVAMGKLQSGVRRIRLADGTILEARTDNNLDPSGYSPIDEIRIIRQPSGDESGCNFSMESGLLDCLVTDEENPVAQAADLLYPVPNVENAAYPVGFTNKPGVGSLIVKMRDGIAGPQTSKALPGAADSNGIHLSKQAGMALLPASVFTGKTRLWAQALYGLPAKAWKQQARFLNYGDSAALVFQWDGGATGYPLGSDFSRTTVIYTTPEYNYWVLTLDGAKIEARRMVLSPCGELLRRWLVDNLAAVTGGMLTGFTLTRLEAFLLSQVMSLGTAIEVAGSAAVMAAASALGGPWYYGWKAKSDGSRLSVVHVIKVGGSGLPGYYQTSVSHIDVAYDGAAADASKFSISATIGSGQKQFVPTGYEQLWYPNDGRIRSWRDNFYSGLMDLGITVYGFYDSTDTWRAALYDVRTVLATPTIDQDFTGWYTNTPNYVWCCSVFSTQTKASSSGTRYRGGFYFDGNTDLRVISGRLTSVENTMAVSGDGCGITVGRVSGCPGSEWVQAEDEGKTNVGPMLGASFEITTKNAGTGDGIAGFSALVIPAGDSSAVYIGKMTTGQWDTKRIQTSGVLRGYFKKLYPYILRAQPCEALPALPDGDPVPYTYYKYCNTSAVVCPVIIGYVTISPGYCVENLCTGDHGPNNPACQYPNTAPIVSDVTMTNVEEASVTFHFYTGTYKTLTSVDYNGGWTPLFVVSVVDPYFPNPFFTTSAYQYDQAFHWGDVTATPADYRQYGATQGAYPVDPTVGWRFVGWA